MKKYFGILMVVLLIFLASPIKALAIGQENFLLLDTYQKLVCGDTEVPYVAAQITQTVYMILQIATPIIIILLGMIDLLKAVMAQKEDEIKKSQQTFVRRLLIGAAVFLVFVLVKVIIGFVQPQNDNPNMWNCVDCFISGENCNIKQDATTVATNNGLNLINNINVGSKVSEVNQILGIDCDKVTENHATGEYVCEWQYGDGITYKSIVDRSDNIEDIEIEVDEAILKSALKNKVAEFPAYDTNLENTYADYNQRVSAYGVEGTLIYKGTYNIYVWVDKNGIMKTVKCEQDKCYQIN